MKKFMMMAALGMVVLPLQAHAITINQAKKVALEKVEGKLKGQKSGKTSYAFEIIQEDGSIGEVEVDKATGAVLNVKIQHMGKSEDLPEPKLNGYDAKAEAKAHMKKTLEGDQSIKPIKSRLIQLNDAWVYEVMVKVDRDDYEVIVNANNGSIISTTKK